MNVRSSLTAFLSDHARDVALAEGGDFNSEYQTLCDRVGIDADPPRQQFQRDDDDEIDLLAAVEARLRSVDEALAAKFREWALARARGRSAADQPVKASRGTAAEHKAAEAVRDELLREGRYDPHEFNRRLRERLEA